MERKGQRRVWHPSYRDVVEKVGLRNLRRHGGDLVRRVEAGEIIAVTVSGREVAQLGPISRDCWRTWGEIAAIFDGPADVNWSTDRGLGLIEKL